MGDTKERIAQTALELFAQKGYEAVSVSDIAGALGLTKGALYRHFESKEELWNALLDEITGALNRKDSVTLVGFGTFIQRHRGARTGKNPQTGQPVKIKASNTPTFKAAKAFKEKVN